MAVDETRLKEAGDAFANGCLILGVIEITLAAGMAISYYLLSKKPKETDDVKPKEIVALTEVKTTWLKKWR